MSSTIPGPLQGVLDVFATTLADVRFGDVDAATLARLATEVDAAANVVAAAQATLESARAALHERQEALMLAAQRALAYARVYAEADAALSARLDAINLPRAARRPRADAAALPVDAIASADALPPRRPRGRPRKVVDTEPMLAGLTPAEAHASVGE
jgi:multidrug efflux pump subunit AcrA (membrane-fusion protein)